MGAAPRECCVYVLHLKDHSFFAGYTRDMKVRLMKHQDGTIHPTAGCTLQTWVVHGGGVPDGGVIAQDPSQASLP